MTLNELYRTIYAEQRVVDATRLKVLQAEAYVDLGRDLRQSDATSELEARCKHLEGQLRIQRALLKRVEADLGRHLRELDERRDEELRSHGL